MDSGDPPRVKQWKEWVASNLKNGVLTQRDVDWIGSDPSPLIDYYPFIGAIFGLTAAGIASRLRLSATLRSWGFTRTVAIATGASGAGYLLGNTLYERSLYRFEQSPDSPVLAQIAKLRRDHAIVRDAAERAQEQLAGSNERHSQSLNEALRALDLTFNNAVESVILTSLIPEDVQVYNASGSEIRHAVESIIQESIEDDGLDLSEHDLELLVDNELRYWKNRPIESASNPAYPATIGSGAIGMYGRFMRRPPIRWRWIPISFVSIYAAAFLYGLGFGTFSRGKIPDDWLVLQLAGMEVRASIAEKIASSRIRAVVQSALSRDNDVDLLVRSASIIGSASRDTHILFSYPVDSSDPLTATSRSEKQPVE